VKLVGVIGKFIKCLTEDYGTLAMQAIGAIDLKAISQEIVVDIILDVEVQEGHGVETQFQELPHGSLGIFNLSS
jgi:hypothetical protein